MHQFKPTVVTIQGTFIVLVAFFLGNAWAKLLPRGEKFEARWRARGGVGKIPVYIQAISFFNRGPWNLKEHAITAITATSASIAAPSSQVFAAQDIFYDLPLSPVTVIFSTISIGLFGYGICGILRPICVWHVDAVYWSSLPTVKVIQGLHWQSVKDSKPIRWFWIAFSCMFAYEFFPAYIFPWLNSVSIPCLAAMHATGSKAATLTNIFGGATNNEGLGLFTLSFDWQYVSLVETLHGQADQPPSTDHIIPVVSSVEVSAASSCRSYRLLLRHDRHILRQCLEREITSLHVDTSSYPRRWEISQHKGLRQWCSRQERVGRIWITKTHWNLRLRYVHGECCGTLPHSTCKSTC